MSKTGKAKSGRHPLQAHPLQALLFLFALAIVPNLLNFFSASYVRRLTTHDIMLAVSPPPTKKAELETQLAAHANLSEIKIAAPQMPNRFMALPARLAAGALTAGMAAEDIAALETATGRAAAKSANAGISNWENNIAARRPDPSNLAPESTQSSDAAPVFVYKIDKPLWHSSTIVVLLHGSGADETSLMPFARTIWPRATLIGVRGRVMQGNERRWYHKLSPTSFDQKEALRETDALARFMTDLAYKNNYALKNMIFVGYSNGANLLTILAMKYPQLVSRAVLLRPMPVLSAMPENNLHKQRILALSGAKDGLYGGYAEQLYAELRQNGAQVISYRIPATHMPGRLDEKIISRWLKLGY